MTSDEAAAETATILDAPSELWAVRIATVIQDYKNLGAALQHDLIEARRVAEHLAEEACCDMEPCPHCDDIWAPLTWTSRPIHVPEQDSTKET